MQKLVWQNSIGDSVDLTSGNYGITEWEGFSNASLNIQSQQVPFQDGSVFLDALIEQRELSVTLKIKDENNLENRYKYRRELIHILNPKLGEGYLIYANDFTSKRIKCIPQIPLFKTHNSNDSGTPEASLAWTACEPYWEDLEEKIVYLKSGERASVENEGDIPCQIEAEFFTTSVTNPQIKNFTNNKKLKLNNTYTKNIFINTNVGQKAITTESLNFINNSVSSQTKIVYAEDKELFCSIGEKLILVSNDGETWEGAIFPTYPVVSDPISQLKDLIYVKKYGAFYIVAKGWGSYGGNDFILKSTNGINWTCIKQVPYALDSICYSEELELFCVLARGHIYLSSDNETWTEETIQYDDGTNIKYSSELSKFYYYFTGYDESENFHNYIFLSSDGENWTRNELPYINDGVYVIDVLYANGKYYVLYSHYLYTSSDLSTYDILTQDIMAGSRMMYSDLLNVILISSQTSNGAIVYYINVYTNEIKLINIDALNRFISGVYVESYGLFFLIGNGTYATSPNGLTYLIKDNVGSGDFKKIIYAKRLNAFYALKGDYFVKSTDGKKWSIITKFTNPTTFTYAENKNMFCVYWSSSPYYYFSISTDGVNFQDYRKDDVLPSVIDMCYSEELELFCLVCEYAPVDEIYYSADGINWTAVQDSSYSLMFGFSAVIYVEELHKFFATFDGGVVSSADGINWNIIFNGFPLSGISYSINLRKLICVGQAGEYILSSDGETWLENNIGANVDLYNVFSSEYTGLTYIIGANGTIYISSDCENWELVNANVSVNLKAISGYKDSVCIGGEGGVLLQTQKQLTQNIISDLTTDSDMIFNLELGENDILISKSAGNLNGKLSFRQKYIGV